MWSDVMALGAILAAVIAASFISDVSSPGLNGRVAVLKVSLSGVIEPVLKLRVSMVLSAIFSPVTALVAIFGVVTSNGFII